MIGLVWMVVLLCVELPSSCSFRMATSPLGQVLATSTSRLAVLPADLSSSSQYQSLKRGEWVKFICGASNQDLPLVRNMCFLYTLAGVDCIDINSDLPVVLAAKAGIDSAYRYKQGAIQKPYLMVSVNDGEDAHFRKAQFNPSLCPADCSRPCERVCPAAAIPTLKSSLATDDKGVLLERCYGCGRCLPVCPLGLIEATSHSVNPKDIRTLFDDQLVDAIEIHTSSGHESQFAKLWEELNDFVLLQVKVVSVSLPNMGAETMPFINSLQRSITSSKHWKDYKGVQIWQSDGRAMSGDIGNGTTHATVNFAKNVLSDLTKEELSSVQFDSGLHFVQLAGGTNIHSKSLASREGLLSRTGFGGFGFGGFARKAISDKLHPLSEKDPSFRIEEHDTEAFEECLEIAMKLVTSIKSAMYEIK